MFGEKISLAEATLVALFSILIVFAVLLSISLLIGLIARIVNHASKPKEVIVKENIVKETNNKNDQQTDKVVAIITAAIAAYLGKDTSRFIVKNIRPINTESNWERVSRTSALH